MRLASATLALALVASVAGCKKLDPEWCNAHPGACNGDGGVGDDAPPGYVNIGGNVTGLAGAGLVLENNAGDDRPIFSNGAFNFATPLPIGSAYAVTVSNSPTNPSQDCTVANGSGTANDNVSDVQVTCKTTAYTVGGNVVGSSGTTNLTDTFGPGPTIDTKSVTADGMFTFGMSVPSGDQFTVTASPSGCRVSGGTGTVGDANISTVVVNCSATMHTIGGTMDPGINGTVQLQDKINGAIKDTINVSNAGSFAFPSLVNVNDTYQVLVSKQPLYPPANQTCTVTNGSGTVNGDITAPTVDCATNSFSVGGNATGITANGGGPVVLQNNLADNYTLNSDMAFTFMTLIKSGASYSVTVLSEPKTMKCSLSKASGTIANANVNNVGVACSYTDPGILCTTTANICTAGTQVCCDPEGSPSCTTSSACATFKLPCDSTGDCLGNGFCCASENKQGRLTGVSCTTMPCPGHYMCDPKINDCGPPSTCKPYGNLPGYYACQ